MTVEYEQLRVSIDAEFSKLDQQMQGVARSVDKAMTQVELRTSSLTSSIEGQLEKISERISHHIEFGLVRPLAEALSLRALIEFTRSVIDNLDQIATKAESLGIVVDENLKVKMEGIKTSWERSWADLETTVASSGLASLIGLIGEGILALPRAAAHAVEGIQQSGLTGKDFMNRDTANPTGNVKFGPDYSQLSATQASAGIEAFYKAASALSDPTGMQKLIASMKLSVQLAADQVYQHTIDLKVIEAAGAVLADQQKVAAAHGDHLTQSSISSIEQARAIVGSTGVAEISKLIQEEFAKGVRQQLIQEIDAIRTTNQRPSAINEAGLSAEVKRNNLASIDAKGKQLQVDERIQGRELTYLDNLRDEARLAGLMPRLREEENALLDQKNCYGVDFKNQHEDEICAMVREKQAAQDIVQVQTAIIDDIANFGDRMEQAGGKFGKAVEGMILDIVKLIVKLEITKVLTDAIGTGGGFLGLGSLFGGGGAVADSVAITASPVGFVGALAGGGPVWSGSPYIVGEKGPELFVPSVPGTIVPNGTGPGGVARDAKIYITVNGARGNSEIQDMVSAGVQQGLSAYDRQALPTRVMKIVNDPMAR